MDFGCGTGLLTLQLQPFVHSITGADSSKGMLDMLRAKLAKLTMHNVRTVLIDSDKRNTLAGSYDLVVSNMTLHHIKEIEPLLAQFHRITAPSGHLCVADLDLDGGQFHDDNTGVFHFGFSRPKLRKTFAEAGFSNVQDTTAAEIAKPAKNGEIRRFTVFLMTARKTK
jgi:ubiquinone/menaquinone biosynthesis C-methylase UbiE